VPVTAGEDERDLLSPKASLVWSIVPAVTLRAAYSQSLGGVSFDESFRLEPTQLAGFNQSFRTIISESLAGSVSAPRYETVGAALDLKLRTHTYLGIRGEILKSDVNQVVGVFDFSGAVPPPPSVLPSSTRKTLDYEEQSVLAVVNQLLGDRFAVGAQYKFTRSELHTRFPQIPTTVSPQADSRQRADLHQAGAYVLWNHPSGWFAQADVQWYHQSNYLNDASQPGDDFYMVNLFAGWRFPRLHGEISAGILNLNDTDYRLNPLNIYNELPRERVYTVRLRINL
jgi:outer membrane receptor protein involved in Fe transport